MISNPVSGFPILLMMDFRTALTVDIRMLKDNCILSYGLYFRKQEVITISLQRFISLNFGYMQY